MALSFTPRESQTHYSSPLRRKHTLHATLTFNSLPILPLPVAIWQVFQLPLNSCGREMVLMISHGCSRGACRNCQRCATVINFALWSSVQMSSAFVGHLWLWRVIYPVCPRGVTRLQEDNAEETEGRGSDTQKPQMVNAGVQWTAILFPAGLIGRLQT